MKKVKLTEDDRKWVNTIDYFFPVWLWLRVLILKIRRFFMIVDGNGGCSKKSPLLCPAEPPFFVLPCDSEASLASFRTTLRDVIPRHASAEGPLASLGATKKLDARGDKKGLGATHRTARGDMGDCTIFLNSLTGNGETVLNLRLAFTFFFGILVTIKYSHNKAKIFNSSGI